MVFFGIICKQLCTLTKTRLHIWFAEKTENAVLDYPLTSAARSHPVDPDPIYKSPDTHNESVLDTSFNSCQTGKSSLQKPNALSKSGSVSKQILLEKPSTNVYGFAARYD